MSQDVPNLSTLPLQLHVNPPRSHLHMKFIQLFCSLFLSLLLFSNILGGWASPLSYAFAAGNPHSHGIPGSLTLRKFLQQGRPDHVYHGPFLRPKRPTQVPTDTRHGQPLDLAHLPPSAGPAKMKPISMTLDSTFLAGSATAKPLDLVGSDQRLEVQIQTGAFDLSQATTATGAHVTGPVTLSLTQAYSFFPGQVNLLGSYTLQLTDSQGHPLSGIHLRRPITYRFHYQPGDIALFDLDPGQLFLTFPTLIRTARSQHRPLGDLVVHLQNDAHTHTLSGQSSGLGPFDLGGDTQNQSPPTPHLASVAGNSGQLSYSYPLTLAPGPAVPGLTLTYSSESTNERHSITSTSGGVGEGWSLSVGSISADVYTSQSAGGAATWYSLNGAGVSDRLVPNASDPTSFLTQHISPLKIQQVTVGGQPCFNVWDASGNEYVFGCTSDSLQYHTDSTGKRTNYRWDLNRVLFANEGPGGAGIPSMTVTYLQDITTSSGYSTVRDAAIKQIVSTNGDGNVASTLDFLYRAPFNYSSNGIAWATAYGNNYNCTPLTNPNHPVPNPPTTLRCDDPVDFGGSGLPAPPVLGTFSLESVWDHAGNDSTNTNLAYRYDFTYTDHPYWSCWDDWTQNQENCAGDHLLTSVVPTVYLKGTAYPRKGLSLIYNTGTNQYIDTTHTVPSQPSQFFGASTYWNYLTGYMDTNTAQGASISYQEAYNNTHASPATSDDDRTDPFYCPKHASNPSLSCTGNFANPQDRAWTIHVVTQITASGSDSSAVGSAVTNYAYGLQVTSNSCPAFNGDTRCVGDVWLPSGSSDFQNYYQGEYHGFAHVYVTSPANDVTDQTYFSNAGWGTPANSFNNYLGGSLYEERVYQGNSTSGPLLRDTVNTYAGTISGEGDSCNGNYSGLYTPCAVLALISVTTFKEGSSNSTPPSIEQDNAFDDYANVQGASLGPGYNNLITQVIKSSNAPTLTRKWTFAPNDQSVGGWVFHTVNKVTHSEVDDSTGKAWSCQDTAYDEGGLGSHPANLPAQGLPTTLKTYSDCANQGATAITAYAGYDGNGNMVESIDGVGSANPGFYGSTGTTNYNGCTLTSSPAVFPPAWSKTNYTTCSVYDGTIALPTSVTNALNQATHTAYDTSQDALPTSTTDANGQQTTLAYSFDSHGNRTVQVSQPGESVNNYTTQSVTNSDACPSSIPTSLHLPCYEIDSNSSFYSQAIKRTFYDAQGRAVETRTAGPDASHDTIVFTVYNDAQHTTFQSVPFEIAHGSGWVDPASAIDPGTSKAPTGTGSFYDALGRAIAMQDPIFGSPGVPGIACSVTLGGNYTACTNYGLGTVNGDTAIYTTTSSIDPNNHVVASFSDVLGRTRYVQYDSGLNGGTLTPNEQKTLQYNVLNEPTSVATTDLAPQGSQTITSVTTTAQYDGLGRLTQVVDPDRGTHSYTYDADGSILSDVSGSRTLGYNDDLLGRVGCVQDALPTIDADGSCTTGTHALVQNTYDQTKLGTQGSTDFPIGRLTKTLATTYYPEGGGAAQAIEKMQYDQRGRLITQHLQLTMPNSWNVTTALPTYQMTVGYNDANQVTTTTTSTLNPNGAGFTTSQVYDSTTGVLSGLSNNANAIANLASLSYTSNALVGSINFQTSSGSALATEQLGYDGDLRVASASATWSSGSGTSGQIFSQSPSYDPASNVTSLSTTHAAVPGQSGSGGSETQNFCYDEQNRLVWSGNSGTQPAAGNGTCGSGTLSNSLNGANYSNSLVYTHLGQLWKGPLNGSGTYKYLYCSSGAPHQLASLVPTGTGANCTNQTGAVYTSSYDTWGNVNGRTYNGSSSILSYDQLDHFVEWNSSSPTTQEWYVYDAAGNRVVRRSTSGGSTGITVYAFGGEEHRYSGTGSNQGNTYYYSLGGRLIGELTSSPASTNFFLTDGLGSVLASFSNVTGSAAVQGNQVYGPYGASRYTKGTMGTNKGFTGQYNDTVTGLDYYNSRYYDPVAGVFLSADTAQGNGMAMNPYAYVGGNPETWSDPTGQMPCGDICGWGGGGGSGSPPASGAGGAAGASSGSNPYTNPYGSSGQANNLPTCSVQGVGCKQWAALEVPTVTRVAVTTNSPVGTSFCPMGVGLPCFTSVQEWQSTRYLYFRSSTGAPLEQCTAGFDCSSRGASSEGEGTKLEVLAADEGGTTSNSAESEAGRLVEPDNPEPDNLNFPGANRNNLGPSKGFADEELATKHINKHGTDFGASSPEEYVFQAMTFMSGAPDANELQLMRTNGDVVRWNILTGEFGVARSDGFLRTYYDISGGADPYAYFLEQYR